MRTFNKTVGKYIYTATETETLGVSMYFNVEVSNPNANVGEIKSFSFTYDHFLKIGLEDYQITWQLEMKVQELANKVWGD